MKKYFYCAIIAFMAISCSESEDPLNEIVPDRPSNAPKSIEAEIPRVESRAVWKSEFENWDDSAQINSRTYAVLDTKNPSEYFQYWHPGDAISLFTTTQGLEYVLVSGEHKDVAKFELGSNTNGGASEPLATNYYYAVYPYKNSTTITTQGEVTFEFPQTQIYAKNSYSQGTNGLIAKKDSKDTDNVYEFKNFCSYLQIKLTYKELEDNTEEENKKPINKNVYKVILKSNDTNEFLSGIGTITYEDDGSFEPVVKMDHEKSTNEIILDCRDKEVTLDTTDPTEFWFVLPGQFTFSNGFNITVIFEDGSYFEKSTAKPITIPRNHITPMKTTNVGDIKKSVIRYKYEESGLKNESDKFPFPTRVEEGYPPFIDENGNPLKYEQIYDEENDEWIISFIGVLATINGNIFVDEYGRYHEINSITIDNCKPITFNSHALCECTAKELIIINDIINLGGNTFRYSYLEEITIVGDVYNIDDLGFANTEFLETLTIHGRVDKIGKNAFSDSNITSVIIDERVNDIGEGAFKGCTNLTTVDIKGIEHIEATAFENCTKLTSIDLSNVHRIGTSAFAGCRALKTVDISGNCVSIGEGAFYGCKNLKTINMLGIDPPTLTHDNGEKVDPYIFPNGAKIYVPDGAYNTYNNNSSWYFYSAFNNGSDYQASIVKPNS